MRVSSALTTTSLSQPSSPQRPSGGPGVVRVAAVLAPADQKPRQPARPDAALKPPAQRSLAGALLSVFRGWDSKPSEADSNAVAALAAATTERAAQADAIEEREKEAKEKGPVPDIQTYLRPAGIMETRYVRALSSLCALTYHLDKLTPSALLRRHRMKLVSTSKVCELKLREARQTAADALAMGDAMAADVGIVEMAQAEIAASEERAANSPAMQAVARVTPLSTVDLAAAASGAAPAAEAPSGSSSPTQQASPVDVVAASLAAAAAAASAAAQGVYSAAGDYAGPLANNITTFTAKLPVRGVAAQLQSAAAVGHSSAIATMATVSAALESTWGRDRANSRGGPLPKECQSPTEWFIVDDPAAHTRYFVIQGSDNLDHWRVNLTFDPVPFEDPSLGIKVHRGVYETAQVLYDRFLPLVQDHLTTSPFAKVAFTGHSLGGSLGTMLMLMYVRRGVLPKSAVSPVYTFGAPAVFCEGGAACGCEVTPGSSDGSSSCGAACRGEEGDACGVLQALGLPEGAVRNVLMHRDIVPRAFACDYTLVADLLKRVSDSFREHRCLNSSKTVLFDFIGKVMVLQPDAESTFVCGEGLHPMLPPTAGLYVLREPTPFESVKVALNRDAAYVRQAVEQAAGSVTNLPAATAAATPASGSSSGKSSPSPKKSASSRSKRPTKPVPNAREAVFELMNYPHPLDILADPGAYGDLGAISRYHNPDNYTRALGGVLRTRGTAWRRLVANAGSVGIRHFAPVLDVSQQRAARAALTAPDASAPASPAADRRPLPGGKQSLLPRLSPHRGTYNNDMSTGTGSSLA